MLRKTDVLMLTAIVALASLSSPYFIDFAHAATGEVCLADPTTKIGSTTPCPATPAVFDGPSGQQIRIGVYIQGSDGLDGFDIALLANHTILRPVGVDLNGTVLQGNFYPDVECLSGHPILGSRCLGADTVDTLHLAAFSGLGAGNTATPTTGLLFTAIYNITGRNSVGSPVSVGFETGCSLWSVPNTCVTITNGGPSAVGEIVQTGATFDNSGSATMATVILSANPTDLGPQLPGVISTANVTATAINGFPGIGTDSVTFTDTAPASLTTTITGTNPCATLGTSCSVIIGLSSTAAGNNTVTVFATYSTQDANGNPDTLTSTASVHLVVWDFRLNLGSSTVSVITGSTGDDTVKVSSQNGFDGSITLSAGNSFPSGLTTIITPTTVVLKSGGSSTSAMRCSAPQNTTGIYRVQVKATSGSRTKTAIVTVTVTAGGAPDFTLSASPSRMVISPNSSANSTISLTAINGFSDLVSFSVISSPGLTASIFPLNITASGNATLTVSSTTVGNYTAQVMGIGGSISHSIAILIEVTLTPIGTVCIVPSGATSCPSSPAPIAAGVGAQVRVSVLIQNSASFDSFDITLLADNRVLLPVGVDILGSVLLPATIGIECIGRVLVQGPTCMPTDSLDTIHLAVLSLSRLQTVSPTTGLLFTAIYNVTASTSGTVLGFQTGCNAPSSSIPPLCIDIGNGQIPTNVRETDPGAVFSTSSLPDFAVTVDPSSLVVTEASKTTSTVFLTRFNEFTGNVTLSTSISPRNSLTCLLDSTIINETSETSALSCGGSGGAYTVTVTGTSSSLSHSVSLMVNVAYFTISANQTTITFDAYAGGASTMTLTSINGFTGTVTLTATASSGITAALSPASINTSGSATLIVNGTTTGTFSVNVTGTSGSLSHSVRVTVVVSQGISAPVFIYISWNHHLSLSKHRSTATQKWSYRISNPNNATTVYYYVQINGIDSSGSHAFTVTSGVSLLTPHHFTLSQHLSMMFTPPSGVKSTTYTFTAVIHWGTSATSQPFTSNGSVSGLSTSGFFTIENDS